MVNETQPGPDLLQEHRNPVVDRLQESLIEAKRTGDSIGLLLVHAAAVDRIDALHGFHAGDKMSNSVAQLLRNKALRKRDVVESLSRDEFACVLRPAPSEGIAMLAANRVVTVLSPPPAPEIGPGDTACLDSLRALGVEFTEVAPLDPDGECRVAHRLIFLI